MPNILDVFSGDAYDVYHMSAAITKAPFVPMRVSQLGLFSSEGSTSTLVAIEEEAGVLKLYPTRTRGGPPVLESANKTKVRPFACSHIPVRDTIKADDIQNKRAFGTADQMETIANVVAKRIKKIRQGFEATREFMMAQALQGIVTDAEGTTVNNLFTQFEVPQPAEVDFVLGTSTTNLEAKALEIVDSIERKMLGAAPYDHIHAFCGPTWFRAFCNHAELKYDFDRWKEGQWHREDKRRGFPWQGIVWEEYPFQSNNSTPFVPHNKAIFFPVGSQDLFRVVYAPADYIETVNTEGQEFYAKQRVLPFDKGIEIEAQSNPLYICTRPEALRVGITSN